MRSPLEIRHRLRQELVNLKLLALPPRLSTAPSRGIPAVLPNPVLVAARLRATEFAPEIERLSGRIAAHRIPLFTSEIDAGPEIDWRRDYPSGKTTGLSYFRVIPYLDAKRTGDHKHIWELNRHQHLVVLAQAFLLLGERRYLDEIEQQLRSWMLQNPFQRGINWASALEVAFRSVSWLWVLHLAGPELPAGLVEAMQHCLYLHGLHIENNLSFYFSPNTHLIGEAVALHALGAMLPHLPSSPRWTRNAAAIVRQQMRAQINNDGSHFEKSTYYHVYALDMLLFHASLSESDEEYRSTLARMADYLSALLGHDRRLPFFGDDDGGRWFHPYGERAAFGRASLAACNAYIGERRWPCEDVDYWTQASWWFAAQPVRQATQSPQSRLFQDSGMAVLHSPACKIVVDSGAFGRGSAGHSHSGALGFTVTLGEEELLIDPGTFTYVGSKEERNYFRGTAAHNTVQIDGMDQADPVNPFRWANPPEIRILRCQTSETEDIVEAECVYRGFRHRRYLHFVKPFAILVVDEIAGPSGEHQAQQHWHFGSPAATSRFRSPAEIEHINGWRSRCFGQREPSPVVRAGTRSKLPVVLPAAIRLAENVDIRIAQIGDSVNFTIDLPAEPKHLFINYSPVLR